MELFFSGAYIRTYTVLHLLKPVQATKASEHVSIPWQRRRFPIPALLLHDTVNRLLNKRAWSKGQVDLSLEHQRLTELSNQTWCLTIKLDNAVKLLNSGHINWGQDPCMLEL